ncbi:MAG TPA: hypothetical protein VKY57_03100, partial [Chitinispirillaceae bacterium]|nr:hypothetical protein [Chitinispirillaceae bacterium]
MTDELGPLSYGEKDEQIFLGREISSHRDYSDKTAEEIDALMRNMIDQQVQRAKKILTDHIEELHRLSKALLEHELLDREEIMRVIAGDTLHTVRKTRSMLKRTDENSVALKPQMAAVSQSDSESEIAPEKTGA